MTMKIAAMKIATMKIASLAARTDHASVRYRILHFIPYLAEEGISIDPYEIPSSFSKRLKLFKKLRAYDLVVLQRKLFNAVNFSMLRKHSRRLVYDVDDALFLKDSRDGGRPSLTRKIRFKRTVSRADFVIAGNSFILAEVEKHNSRCAELPTVVDLSMYPVTKNHGSGKELTAVWIGGRSTLFYLQALIPWLEPLAAAIPGFGLTVISDVFPESDDLPITKVPWSVETEVKALLSADVGMMPLFDDGWTRGKCGLKLIQYGAAGLPSLFSPVGVNPTIVLNGVTGFGAAKPEEWRESLVKLSEDGNLRVEMGREARKRIESHYSLETTIPRLVGVLRSASGTSM